MKGIVDDLALLSLCDGYGGTELALRSVGRVRTVCRVERDAYAAAVLVARMEEQALDPAPLWDDVGTFDGAAWRGRVDIVAAGFPCPDFSSAGLRAGVDGEHWLWPECYKIIRDVGPGWVLLENVPGLVRLGGLTRVLSDLALDGFDAEWGLYSAADIGAPHERERWWLVAHRNRDGLEVVGLRSELSNKPDDTDRRSGALLGDTSSARRQQITGSAHGDETTDGREPHTTNIAAGSGETMADPAWVDEREPDNAQRAESRVGSRVDIGGHSFPPRRGDVAGWGVWEGAQPALCRSVDGSPDWLADRLHLGGNGLVPQCAAEAWSQLIERLER